MPLITFLDHVTRVISSTKIAARLKHIVRLSRVWPNGPKWILKFRNTFISERTLNVSCERIAERHCQCIILVDRTDHDNCKIKKKQTDDKKKLLKLTFFFLAKSSSPVNYEEAKCNMRIFFADVGGWNSYGKKNSY